MNAIEWNRDLTRPLDEIRQREMHMKDKNDRGRGTVCLPELRKGRVGLVVATQLARYTPPGSALAGWSSPQQAWAMTQAQRSADRLAGRLRGLVLAWAGMRTFTVGRQMIEFADQIGVAAERLSVTAEQLQVFRYAAEDAANIGVQQADIALQRFSRRVAEAAQGTGTLLSVTQRYGIQLRDSEGRLRPIMDILRDYADAVASAESDAATFGWRSPRMR